MTLADMGKIVESEADLEGLLNGESNRYRTISTGDAIESVNSNFVFFFKIGDGRLEKKDE